MSSAASTTKLSAAAEPMRRVRRGSESPPETPVSAGPGDTARPVVHSAGVLAAD